MSSCAPADGPPAAATPDTVYAGYALIEAVVDSDHDVDTVYD
jgi:hypothetical protein